MKHYQHTLLINFFLSIVLLSSVSRAQHFIFTGNTGNNMTVVVQTSINPTIDGSPIQVGDEIGVFTPAGLLVGASVWTGSNIAITVWGNDKETDPVIDGIKPDETLHFRMWDEFDDKEYVTIVSYTSGDPFYAIDGISVLASMKQPPVIEVDPVSQDKYVGENVSFSISVSGTPPLTYQWKKDGSPLSGKTNPTLDLTSLILSDAGDYTCEVTNAVSSHESAAATLTVSIRPAITVTSPNGGEIWLQGSSHSISWTHAGTVTNVRIEYTTDNGSNWTEIIGSTPNVGSHPWTVPVVNSTICKVKVSETDGVPSDESDDVFTIEPVPAITVTSPNGGEILVVGNTHTITWTHAGTVGVVMIEYSTDNGSNYSNVVPSTANNGSYSWTVPEAVSIECLVRISEVSNGSVVDVSDANFTIAYQLQTIDLLAGWHMISFNVNPLDDNVSAIFSDIASLVLVKNNAGQTYMPPYSIDDIGTITITEGYKVYLGADDVLTVTGIPVDIGATAVPLAQGWNMIAYLPQNTMLIVDAFKDITSDITIVKNNDGQTYVPDWGINTIINMNPGEGYKIHMKTATSFNYPAPPRTPLTEVKMNTTEELQPSHFMFTDKTGNNMTVIVTTAINPLVGNIAIENSDEIGVFTASGLCVGGAVWSGNNIAVTVWGDDDQTSPVDGISAGEMLQFRLWDASANQEYTAAVVYTSGGPEYSVDGIAVPAKLESADQVAINQTDPLSLKKTIQFFVTPSFVSHTSGEPALLMATSKKVLTNIRFSVYDPLGNVITTGTMDMARPDSRGTMLLGNWNGRTSDGRKVATGTYLVVVTVIDGQGTRKRFKSFIGVRQ